MKIGLCLSGSGVRAAVFHLGALDRLATQELLDEVHCFLTVSGGSLATGLIFSLSGLKWQESAAYRSQIPRIGIINALPEVLRQSISCPADRFGRAFGAMRAESGRTVAVTGTIPVAG